MVLSVPRATELVCPSCSFEEASSLSEDRSWSFSADLDKMDWYTCIAREDAPAATAAPIREPASPILVDKNKDVAAASALEITAAKETLSKNPFFLGSLSELSVF